MKKITKNDLPIGTKVVPHNKTQTEWGEKEESESWAKFKEQGFLYVADHDQEYNCLILWHDLSEIKDRGDFYNYSDVTIYQEPIS